MRRGEAEGMMGRKGAVGLVRDLLELLCFIGAALLVYIGLAFMAGLVHAEEPPAYAEYSDTMPWYDAYGRMRYGPRGTTEPPAPRPAEVPFVGKTKSRTRQAPNPETGGPRVGTWYELKDANGQRRTVFVPLGQEDAFWREAADQREIRRRSKGQWTRVENRWKDPLRDLIHRDQ